MDPNQHEPSDDSPEHERVGHTLENRYRIVEVLAQGGMGVVYRGERIGLNRPVAIKFLHANFAADPQARERFGRELQVMSKLTHPNCVSVIDYGIADSPFIVMEFVTGRTLKDMIASEGRIQPARALLIVSQILNALAHAHSQDMVHRDIKPANVVLANVEGVIEHVYVLDFGLAKFLSSAASDQNELTASWMVLGTPAYMSPEQARAEPIGAATDIYATGVVLFELLTGSKPYYAENPIDTLQLHQTAPVPSIRERLPEADFSEELDQVVQTALAKDASRRFPSASAFAEALDDVPEATPTLTSTRLRALTATPRVRAESARPNTEAGSPGEPLAAAIASGHAAHGGAGRPGTMSLSNGDLMAASSAAVVPGKHAASAAAPQRSAPIPDKESGTAAPDSRSSAVAAEQSPRARRSTGSAPSGSRVARFVLASMLLAVAVVVSWYATRDEVLQPEDRPGAPADDPALADTAPAPVTPEARQDEPAPPAPPAPPAQAAATTPDAAAATATEQLAAAAPDAGALAAPGEQAAAAPAEGDGPLTSDEAAGGEQAAGSEQAAVSEQVAGGEIAEPSAPPPDEKPDAQRPRPRAPDQIDEIERLVEQGRRDEAIRRIIQLRRTDFPRSGYLAYVLGNLYFAKRQWGNGLEAYEDALRLKPDYRSQATINENTIRAFSQKQTWPKARALFLGHIRQAGLRYLRQAAQSDKNAVVRERAKQVISAINRR
jgi:serine/threonine protein kinase